MKIGALYALLSVITWSIISVITRFCLLNYEANILVFASMQIFAGGVALLLIRKPVTAEGWKAGVGYSWLYTLLQIFRNFFLAAVYLYITSTETSLLINIEVVVTAILAYIFFKRKPHSSDIVGMLVITVGIILFIRTLPETIQLRVSILVSLAVLASCTRAIVVEKTTVASPNTSVRQKCGISGFTMFWGGTSVMLFLTLIALVEHYFAKELMAVPFSML
ncbi:MAG TPA: EamA family transporter, partial [Butyricimonas sp.]